MSEEIEKRKREHIETVLSEDVSGKGLTNGFDRYYFEHVALPGIDFDQIRLETEIFGRVLRAPILISSMTGGTRLAHDINLKLAGAAQALGVAMGVGSQRAAIEDPSYEDTYRVRKVAPDILLFANLGAIQLNYGYSPDHAKKCVEMIEANALFLHLNPLQEVLQVSGDRNWSGLIEKIGDVVETVGVPVVAKEVGNGISGFVAQSLADVGVLGVDVAGAGGTSWSEVEAHRQSNDVEKEIAHSFACWGIPTAEAINDVISKVPGIKVFASGGIRNGIEVAKAINLGADLVGIAAPTLKPAIGDQLDVEEHIKMLLKVLRISMFCVGAEDLTALRKVTLKRVNGGTAV